MSSISSKLMSCVTAFRNPNGPENKWVKMPASKRAPINPLKAAAAEIGYMSIVPFALFEAAISRLAKLVSNRIIFSNACECRNQFINNWADSSAFSAAWSACNVVVNPMMSDLIVSEKVARACASRAFETLMTVPVEV